MNRLFILLLIVGLKQVAFAQQEYTEAFVNEAGDTVYVASLDKVTIVDKRTFASNKERSDFNKLKRNVSVVYPYAMIAGELYREMNDTLDQFDKKRQTRKYKKAKEKALKEEFTDQLKDLTVTQGKILVMLINRETGNNCYELIKDLKSPFAAWTWQIVAKHWDYDLKEPYIPEDNPDLELILTMIKAEE